MLRLGQREKRALLKRSMKDHLQSVTAALLCDGRIWSRLISLEGSAFTLAIRCKLVLLFRLSRILGIDF